MGEDGTYTLDIDENTKYWVTARGEVEGSFYYGEYHPDAPFREGSIPTLIVEELYGLTIRFYDIEGEPVHKLHRGYLALNSDMTTANHSLTSNWAYRVLNPGGLKNLPYERGKVTVEMTHPDYKTFSTSYNLHDEEEMNKVLNIRLIPIDYEGDVEDLDNDSNIDFSSSDHEKKINEGEKIPAGSVVVNGTILQEKVITENNRTLAPFRAIFEALGAQVDYDSATRTATGTKGDTEVKLTLNKKEALVNGKTQILDVPAKTYSGKTYVPIRFVGEYLGASVDYVDGSVIITTK